MGIETREIAPEQLGELRRTVAHAFGQDPDDAELQRDKKLLELGRNRAAFDGGRLVGAAGAYSLELTVPGATMPTAGVSNVTVLPSHRRKGVMRRMMVELLDDARGRGDLLAALWSSEKALYGRFGYGVAGVTAHLLIDRFPLNPHRLAPAPAQVTMIDADEARVALPSVFDRKRRQVPAMFARSPAWWELEVLADYPRHRRDDSLYRYALALDPGGEPIGYARYRTRGCWEGISIGVTVTLEEMIALTPEASAGLWGFLVNHDLIRTLRAWNVPAEAALHHLFDNFRETQTLSDGLWVRILDVEAALSGRRYSADGVLTLEVADPLDNRSRRYRLEVVDGEGSCEATSGRADLVMDQEDLGGAFLGRSRFRRLGALGRVRGHPDALSLADAMFDWHPQPWCQEVF